LAFRYSLITKVAMAELQAGAQAHAGPGGGIEKLHLELLWWCMCVTGAEVLLPRAELGAGASLHPGLRQERGRVTMRSRTVAAGACAWAAVAHAHRTSIRSARLSVQRTVEAGMEGGLAQQL